jgi:deoxyribose-phosphate aldolase
MFAVLRRKVFLPAVGAISTAAIYASHPNFVANCLDKPKKESVGRYIDHTILKQTCSEQDIQAVCDEARQFQFKAVCIPPYWIPRARQILHGSNVQIATVIGFPFGYSAISAKAEEIKQAIKEGVHEVDIVANICAIKSGNYDYVRREIIDLLAVIRAHSGIICKVIIESGVLTKDEIIECCKIYDAAGIDYLKTSTGFAPKGATVEDVQLFRQYLSKNVQIKASGGIRSYHDAEAMIAAGATRLGCSASVTIAREEVEVPQETSKNSSDGY